MPLALGVLDFSAHSARFEYRTDARGSRSCERSHHTCKHIGMYMHTQMAWYSRWLACTLQQLPRICPVQTSAWLLLSGHLRGTALASALLPLWASDLIPFGSIRQGQHHAAHQLCGRLYKIETWGRQTRLQKSTSTHCSLNGHISRHARICCIPLLKMMSEASASQTLTKCTSALSTAS